MILTVYMLQMQASILFSTHRSANIPFVLVNHSLYWLCRKIQLSWAIKTKLFFFAGDSIYTKTSSDDSIMQNSSDTHVVPCNTSYNVSKSSKVVGDVGTTLQLQLADKNTYFSGNKNKTGFSDGDYMGANIIEDSSYDNNVENCGDVTDVMDTAILEQDLYQNCSRNSSNDSGKVQNSVCDTVYTNGIHTDVFGFIPKGPLKLYDGNPTTCNCISDIIRAHLMIKDSGIPNYLGCRIPVASNLKCHIWSQHLQNYWDKELPDLLQFGFLLDFNRTVQLNSTEQNHKSALENSSHVEKYIAEELQHGAILGPFDGKPIHLHTSPLMVRDKQDSDSKRTIMDLS